MQVVIRSLSVLRLLGGSTRGYTLVEISERLELPVASMHRVLAVLEKERFVMRSPINRRYFLGPDARDLGKSTDAQKSPLVVAHRAVAEASELSGETVFLSELTAGRVVCSALSQSAHPLRLYVRVGQEMPLHAAASARVLLAWRNVDEVRDLLVGTPFLSFTKDTPQSVEQVLERLQLIRSRGFDTCESELDENVWAISAPVFSASGEVVASVTLAAPGQRMLTTKSREAAIAVIKAAASRMSAGLGWSDGSQLERSNPEQKARTR